MSRAMTRARALGRDLISRSHRARAFASAPADAGAPKLWPSVRALLDEHGLDARALMPGSGPNGHLTRADVMFELGLVDRAHLERVGVRRPIAIPDVKPTSLVEDYAFGLARAQTSTEETVGKMRRVIASRLAESKSTAPHAYASADVDVSEIAALRKKILDETGAKVSVNDCVMYAVGRTLREVPALNAGWDAARGTTSASERVDVSVAVATEDGGLITPIVTRADEKTLTEIGADVRALAKKAREGTLRPEEFMGGSFSVSNLGMFGVDSFAAILNPPQGAILAVGAGKDRVVLVDGRPTTVQTMTATVSADRRVADEADAARWLDAFAAQFRRTETWAV